MKNRKRREKLADLLFELVKYILTVVVVSGLFAEKFSFLYWFLGVFSSLTIIVVAYFLTPQDKE